MKKLTLALMAFIVLGVTACSNPEDEAKERLETTTLSNFRSVPLVAADDAMIRFFMGKAKIPESAFVGMRSCFSEYANAKAKSITTSTALGWCQNEFERGDENFSKHVDLTPFLNLFSQWDGAFTPIEDSVKKSLHDPESYKHSETRYVLHLSAKEPYASVTLAFHAKNGFGAMRKGSVNCDVDLKTLDIKLTGTDGL